VELELGYRLPAEVHDVTMRLLPHVAPTLRSPRAVRRTGHEVMLTTTDAAGLATGTVSTIRELLGTGLIGVVCPAAVRAELAGTLDADGLAWSSELRAATSPVVVLGADEVKGLEFDCVVVVEPAQIVAEAEHGLRSLFVALTRCTSRLALVHSEPLPDVLGLAPPEPEAPTPAPDDDETGGQDAVVVDLSMRGEDDEPPGAVVVNLSVVDDDEPTGGVVVDLAHALGQAGSVGPDEPDLDPVDAAVARDAFDGLERQIAQAIAATVAEKIRATIRPEMLTAVANELVRLLRPDAGDRRD
jgi:UvrD-like helicase C-terminal domain